ncbi:MAG: cation transporter [Bryobacterales bacterium]|nr:cation transporter [Bryobacterales bacterium]
MTANERALRRGSQIALVSVVASGLLSVFNVALGWAGGSTSVIAAGAEFAGDVLASAVVLLGMRLGARPADENHPYGHGRVEILAGLLVGMILSVGGLGICFRSAQKIAEVHPPPAGFTMYPLAAAIVVKSILSSVKFQYGRKIRSASLVADAWNDAVDILSAMAAMGALMLTMYDPARFLAADHYGGFTVGLVVIFSGLRVIRDSSMELMDTMPEQDIIDEMRRIAMRVPNVRGVEKCYARKTGLQYHADLHLEVDPNITVREGHDIATEVRIQIKETMQSIADVLVHVEPDPRMP